MITAIAVIVALAHVAEQQRRRVTKARRRLETLKARATQSGTWTETRKDGAMQRVIPASWTHARSVTRHTD